MSPLALSGGAAEARINVVAGVIFSSFAITVGCSIGVGVASTIFASVEPRRRGARFCLFFAGEGAAKERLGLSEDDIRFSRDVFRTCGNMSSPTVLFVLDGVMASGQPRPGDFAVMAAMGAGFAAEAALLRWVE